MKVNYMRIIFNVMSILIVVAIVSLAFLNNQIVFDLILLASNANFVVYHHIDLMLILLIAFIAGLNVGIFWSAAYYLPLQERHKEYQKKLEKTSIESEEGESKIAVLEEKIKVLEKALDNALGKTENE